MDFGLLDVLDALIQTLGPETGGFGIGDDGSEHFLEGRRVDIPQDRASGYHLGLVGFELVPDELLEILSRVVRGCRQELLGGFGQSLELRLVDGDGEDLLEMVRERDVGRRFVELCGIHLVEGAFGGVDGSCFEGKVDFGPGDAGGARSETLPYFQVGFDLGYPHFDVRDIGGSVDRLLGHHDAREADPVRSQHPHAHLVQNLLLHVVENLGLEEFPEMGVIPEGEAHDVDVDVLHEGGVPLKNHGDHVDRSQAQAFHDLEAGSQGAARIGIDLDLPVASLADETPEGRSIVVLAKEQFGLRGRELKDKNIVFIPFSATTRMSGVDYEGVEIRKGAAEAIKAYVEKAGGHYSAQCQHVVEDIARRGGTPLVVAKNHRIFGVINLKDIVKDGVKERFADLRKMGIKTIMITGDNPLTAAAIAAEAGVDDFLAEATPEGKLNMIREYQAQGHLVAMTGDGTNDAPALAQADVAVAMNSGTQAAKEAGNMVDLDSSPTKLIDIVRIGKQLLMTRGSLTTFSIANDVAKYFAIIPALFMGLYPGLAVLNIMNLHSMESAILSATIYNALIIVALIPLALKGVRYREVPAGKLLSWNLLVYGLGGIVTPFIFMKIIDLGIVALGLA